MKSNLYEKKAQIFKALSNPVRLEIIDFLADGEKCVCEIVEKLNYEQPHISKSLIKLKEAGLWICGTSIGTEKYYFNQDLTGPIGIVIGNEGKGMSELVEKNCDFLVKIPMMGKVESLNASVSTGIILYEALKQRKF